MKIVDPSYEILTNISKGGIEELKHIERCGRVCYKSEDKISDDGESAKSFVKMLIERGHEAMLEHSNLCVKFILDRGSTHDLVRHRIASFAQESTRYCNYAKEKFGSCLTFVRPHYFMGCNGDTVKEIVWMNAMRDAEMYYLELINLGSSPQEARSVLPNSLKAELIISANYREWRNILRLRTAKNVHPHIKQVMIPLLMRLKNEIPVVFDDILLSWWEPEEG